MKKYFNDMFVLTHQYKYTLTELENMIPWERDTYVSMLNVWVKEETEKMKQKNFEQESKLNQIIGKVKQKRRK